MMPRLCDNRVGYFSMSVMDYARPDQKAAERCFIAQLSAREEGSGVAAVGAGEADRVLHRPGDAEAVGAVADQGRGGLEAGVRGGGVQERDRGEGSAEGWPDWSPEDARYSVIQMVAVARRRTPADLTCTTRAAVRS